LSHDSRAFKILRLPDAGRWNTKAGCFEQEPGKPRRSAPPRAAGLFFAGRSRDRPARSRDTVLPVHTYSAGSFLRRCYGHGSRCGLRVARARRKL